MTRHIRLDDPAPPRLECEAFARLLPEWLEHDLRAGSAAAVERHRAECAACAALVADLDLLRTAAAALPPREPSRDLWAGIEARIAPTVVALPVAASARRHHWRRGAWAAAASALLVAGLGGAMLLHSHASAPGPAHTAHIDEAAAPAPTVAAPVVAVSGDAPTPTPAVIGTAPPTDAIPPGARAAVRGRPAAGPRVATVALADVAPSPVDAEIAALRRALAPRRRALDATTLRALDTDIAVLDGAIRESRTALRDEPTSRLLHDQLNQALDAKLALMRTAVILANDE